MPSKSANVKNEKQYEKLKEKGMSKERAAKIANSPGASSRGGNKSGGGEVQLETGGHDGPEEGGRPQGREGERQEELTRFLLDAGILCAVRRALAAIVVLAAGAAAVAAPSYGESFSPRVAAGLQAARAPLGQLARSSERRSHGTTFVHVRQRVDGIPVLGSDATLSLGADGERLLLDHTRPDVALPPAARLSRPAAIRRARSVAQTQTLRAPIRAGLAIAPRLKRLVWRVVIPSASPLGDYEVLVDARSGSARATPQLDQERERSGARLRPQPRGRAGVANRARRQRQQGQRRAALALSSGHARTSQRRLPVRPVGKCCGSSFSLSSGPQLRSRDAG